MYTGNDLYFPKAADDDVLADLRKLRDWLGRFPKLRQWAASKLIDPSMTEEARQRSWKLLSSVRPVKFNESEWHVPREQASHVCATSSRPSRSTTRPSSHRVPASSGRQRLAQPFYGRESCSIAVHAAADEPYQYLIDDCAPIYRRHGGRPHWGKLHLMGTRELSAMYPKVVRLPGPCASSSTHKVACSTPTCASCLPTPDASPQEPHHAPLEPPPICDHRRTGRSRRHRGPVQRSKAPRTTPTFSTCKPRCHAGWARPR